MKRSSEQFSFWLTPNAEAEECLNALIRSLASRFDAPVFASHLTLHGGASDEQAALGALQDVSAEPGYELEVDGIGASSSFTKTLFIRFRLCARLEKLRLDLGDILQVPNDSPFDPHLSLLYKEMPLPEKKSLVQMIKLPMASVRFDGLSLVAHPAEIRTYQDVEVWRIIARRPLSETSR